MALPKRPYKEPLLPDASQEAHDFLDSSFFKDKNPLPQLPLPSEVLTLATSPLTHPAPVPVRFEESNLIVKYGPCVTVTEALNLSLVKQLCGNKVPVPEVYGWRVEGNKVFIYMELVRGDTLKDRWHELSDMERLCVSMNLHKMMATLRSFEQPSNDILIGSVNRQKLLDFVLRGEPQDAPFSPLATFNDYFCQLPLLKFTLPEGFENPWRKHLPDSGEIVLTHEDIHPGWSIVQYSTVPPI